MTSVARNSAIAPGWCTRWRTSWTSCPRGASRRPRRLLHEIYEAETKAGAEKAFDLFVKTYEAKYPKATECLSRRSRCAGWCKLVSVNSGLKAGRSVRSHRQILTSRLPLLTAAALKTSPVPVLSLAIPAQTASAIRADPDRNDSGHGPRRPAQVTGSGTRSLPVRRLLQHVIDDLQNLAGPAPPAPLLAHPLRPPAIGRAQERRLGVAGRPGHLDQDRPRPAVRLVCPAAAPTPGTLVVPRSHPRP